MSSFVSRENDPKAQYFYSRKEKSLGLLCTNFLSLYDREDVESIGLDDAASRLGVERRRIYDIVNILESVGILARKAKNQYSWKGFGAIPRALEELKEEGLRENFSISDCCNFAKSLDDIEEGGSSNSKSDGQDRSSGLSKNDNRREKSLGLLTRNFIKLFLCSDADLISLDCAAMALLGDGHNSTAMRNNSAAKVRRLYDIANVLSSMNLIEKTPHPESRKPAFRWLGVKGKLKNASATAMDVQQPKKRVFGTDVTNYSLKRNKADSSTDWKSNQNINMPLHMKPDDLENNGDGLEQNSKHSSKGFVFGPFTPASAPGVGESANKIMKPTQDWESLASTFRPQYRNQAISDLFGHYVEAWKSWYVEVAGKKQTNSR
ncbi:E2F transcription factor-like E2FF isoform X1 [Vitis vinifera]|nr:E2F transcription factor-like E2FF isoform X1 [Vitis vinifera]XP_019080257.1 E2F transcription factor-like E2FF isoform X1 [Vitis vinifera]|eukprot:XP_010660999.1 PREDICTED: E2F transcription factor-like E2FF isoform X1 [Vitis vinifera]